jgi:3-deoxy-D-manno-octulosonic-acid transferase
VTSLSYSLYGFLTELIFYCVKFLDKFGIKTFPDLHLRHGSTLKAGQNFWFHAASVGEVRGVSPLITLFLENNSPKEIVITTTSISGKKEAMRLFPNVEVMIAPFDSPSLVRKFISTNCPRLLVINETELWPSMIMESAKRGVKCVLVNGRISEGTFKTYKFFSFFFSRILNKLDKIFVQTEIDSIRFKEISRGFENLKVYGSTKYDFPHVLSNVDFNEWWHDLSRNLNIDNESLIFSFGSVREEEEKEIIGCIKEILSSNKFLKIYFVIAPRHADRFFEIQKVLKKEGLNCISRSDKISSSSNIKIVVLNKIGELLDVYKNSDLCFVGGTFSSVGGHNILEPAYFAKPIIVGRNTYNMKDIAEELEYAGGLIKVANGHELANKALELFHAKLKMIEMGAANFKINQSLKGTTRKIYEELKVT